MPKNPITKEDTVNSRDEILIFEKQNIVKKEIKYVAPSHPLLMKYGINIKNKRKHNTMSILILGIKVRFLIPHRYIEQITINQFIFPLYKIVFPSLNHLPKQTPTLQLYLKQQKVSFHLHFVLIIHICNKSQRNCQHNKNFMRSNITKLDSFSLN